MQDDTLVGCAALHIFWKDLAEIKSVAVLESSQHKGNRQKTCKGMHTGGS